MTEPDDRITVTDIGPDDTITQSHLAPWRGVGLAVETLAALLGNAPPYDHVTGAGPYTHTLKVDDPSIAEDEHGDLVYTGLPPPIATHTIWEEEPMNSDSAQALIPEDRQPKPIAKRPTPAKLAPKKSARKK